MKEEGASSWTLHDYFCFNFLGLINYQYNFNLFSPSWILAFPKMHLDSVLLKQTISNLNSFYIKVGLRFLCERKQVCSLSSAAQKRKPRGHLPTRSQFNGMVRGRAEAKTQRFLEPRALMEVAFEHFPFLQWRSAFFHNSTADPAAQINLFFLNPSCQKIPGPGT